MAAAFLVMRFLLFFWLTDVTCSSALVRETFQVKEQDDPSESLDHYRQRGPFPVKWPPRARFSNFPFSSQSSGKICSDMKRCGTGRYVIKSRSIPSELAEERKAIYGSKHGPKPSNMFSISFPIPHQLKAKRSNVLYRHGLHHHPHPPKQYCPGSHHPHSPTHCPGPDHHPPKHPGPGPHHVHQGIHNPHEPKRPGPGPHNVHQGIHYPYQPKLPVLGPHHVHQGKYEPYQPKLPGLGPHHPSRHCPLHGPCPEPHKHRRPYSAKLDLSRVMQNLLGRWIKPDEHSPNGQTESEIQRTPYNQRLKR